MNPGATDEREPAGLFAPVLNPSAAHDSASNAASLEQFSTRVLIKSEVIVETERRDPSLAHGSTLDIGGAEALGKLRYIERSRLMTARL